MKKRTVWFGMPVFIVRYLRALLIYILALMAFYTAIDYLIDTEFMTVDFVFDNWMVLILVVLLPILIEFVLCWKWSVQMRKFKKQFKKLHGRVCLRCGYEIAEGLERCSECGARWSLEDLSKGWRKLAEGKK